MSILVRGGKGRENAEWFAHLVTAVGGIQVMTNIPPRTPKVRATPNPAMASPYFAELEIGTSSATVVSNSLLLN